MDAHLYKLINEKAKLMFKKKTFAGIFSYLGHRVDIYDERLKQRCLKDILLFR